MGHILEDIDRNLLLPRKLDLNLEIPVNVFRPPLVVNSKPSVPLNPLTVSAPPPIYATAELATPSHLVDPQELAQPTTTVELPQPAEKVLES